MSKLKKQVYARIATAENCGLAPHASCSCKHTYCQCGSSPSDYVASDNQHYWSDESNQAI